jgi:hypothetical protein
MMPRPRLEYVLADELARPDRTGQSERISAVRGMLTLLDTIDRVCRDSRDNYRYLQNLLDDAITDDTHDEEVIEERQELADQAPDAVLLEILVDAIYSGIDRTKPGDQNIWTARLVYQVRPRIQRTWDSEPSAIDARWKAFRAQRRREEASE